MLPRSRAWLVALTLGVVPLAAATLRLEPDTEDLVFQGESGGLPELWILRGGSRRPVRLLPPGIAAFHPATSIRGEVAFMRPAADGRQTLWLASRDGSGLQRWSADTGDIQLPAFSPDGQRMAYVRIGNGGNPEIWIAATHRQDHLNLRPRRLVASGLAPAWSPDGTRIAFASNRDGHYRIWTTTSDGLALSQVTTGGAGDREPAWAPDGQRLVLVRQFATGDSDLVIHDLRTGAEQRLVLAGTESRPAWSSSGRRIAFASDRDGELELYTVAPDGNQLQRLTHNTVRDQAPAWVRR
jgi:TolB protein